MNRKSRLIALTLALMTTVSCGGNAEKVSETTAAPSDETTLPEDTEITLDLPALDYGKREVTILGWNSWDEIEFQTEEETGDVINDAIYIRNRAVEERLNVKLTFLEEGGRSGDQTWLTKVRTSANASDGSYDIVAGHSHNIGTLTTDNYLCNLLDLDYLDLSKPWWRSSLTENATIKKHLFFCTGDISPSALTRIQGVYFNTRMIDEYKLENPYDVVLDGRWTTDKLMEMSKGVYSDVNGDGKKSEYEDIFGFMIEEIQVQAIGFAAGMRSITTDADGNLIPNKELVSNRSDTLVSKWIDFLHNSNDACIISKEDDWSAFQSGRALFWGWPTVYMNTGGRDMKDSCGFIPYPKFDETQESYITFTSNAYSLWAIPVDATDKDMSAALLETLAYEGSSTIMPAVFEVAYKVKYNQTGSEKQTAIFDLIRDSMTFDIGRVFPNFTNGLFYMIPNAIIQNNNTLASTYASIAPGAEKALQGWMEKLE